MDGECSAQLFEVVCASRQKVRMRCERGRDIFRSSTGRRKQTSRRRQVRRRRDLDKDALTGHSFRKDYLLLGLVSHDALQSCKLSVEKQRLPCVLSLKMDHHLQFLDQEEVSMTETDTSC